MSNLSPQQHEIILLLGAHPGATVAYLSGTTGRSLAAVRNTLGQLGRLGIMVGVCHTPTLYFLTAIGRGRVRASGGALANDENMIEARA